MPLLYFPLVAGAQQTSTYPVRKFNPRHLDAFIVNEEVRGYYFVYSASREYSETRKYRVQFYDRHLKKTVHRKLNSEPGEELLNVKSDGKNLYVHFFNSGEGHSRFCAFDSVLGELGELLKIEKKGTGVSTYSLAAMPEKGFVVYNYDWPGKAILTGYFPHGEKRWNAIEIPTVGRRDLCWVIGETDKYVVVSGLFYPDTGSPYEQRNERWLRLINTVNGREMIKVIVPGDSGFLQFNTCIEEPGGYMLAGHFLRENAKGTGVALFNVSKDGKVLAESYIHTAEILYSMNSNSALTRELKGSSFFFHRLVCLSGGRRCLVFEAYKEDQLGDLLIIELDQYLAVKNVRQVQKHSDNKLSEGISASQEPYQWASLRRTGYCFTTTENHGQTCSIVYLDSEKRGLRRMPVIRVAGTPDIKETEVKIQSGAVLIKALPAIPGYIAVFEYSRRQKDYIFRLAKK